jgi:hypothetical protein
MKLNLLVFFLAIAALAQAQYSYISDRRFFAPDDLVGYDFKPAVKEIPNEDKVELDPGEYSFGISFNHLYVKGQGIEGVYNINNIHPEEYGFKLLLMNARDARLQGHLKVILNKYSMVEALIFKRSPNEKEIIFYQTAIPGKVNEEEKAFFTDRGELVIESTDSLWGKTFYPFLRIHKDANVQERLKMKDSTSVTFIETITVVEKDAKKKNKAKEETEVDSMQAAVNEIPAVVTDTAIMEAPERKVKITKEYFVEVRSILQYKDGLRENTVEKFPIKKIVEKEDEGAGLQEEKYRWEFLTDDKTKIVMYLNGDHSVSSFEQGEKTYLMRGF